MSKPLSAKKKIKIAVLLGGLGLVAVYTNSDVLFGQPLEPLRGNAQAPAEETAPSVPSAEPAIGEGKSVSANELGDRNGGEGRVRNPFQTRREQDPLEDPGLGIHPDDPDPEMPPGLRAQIIFLGGKGQKVASIEGKQIEEGEAYYGGRVLLIEAKLVTVAFKGGKVWKIPFGGEPTPAPRN